jgi:hypothetical protein
MKISTYRYQPVASKETLMCPVCLATAALIAAGVATTGGLATGLIKHFGGKHAVDNHPAQPLPDNPKGNP